MKGCVCRGTHPRYLDIACPDRDQHEAWSRRERRPVAYHPGTFHVEPRCLCLGNHRYFSVTCEHVASHGRHAEQDWYSETPVFEEGYMTAAKEYHTEILAKPREPLPPEPVPEPLPVREGGELGCFCPIVRRGGGLGRLHRAACPGVD